MLTTVAPVFRNTAALATVCRAMTARSTACPDRRSAPAASRGTVGSMDSAGNRGTCKIGGPGVVRALLRYPTCWVEVTLLRLFWDHVDGPLAARIAWVRGDVEADALPDLQHLEAAIGDRGMMEKEFAAARIAIRLNESEATIAERSDRTGCHRLEPTLSAALLARRHGGARASAGALPQTVFS